MEDLGKKGQLVGGLPVVSGGMVVSAKGTLSEPVNATKEGIVGGYLIVKDRKTLMKFICSARTNLLKRNIMDMMVMAMRRQIQAAAVEDKA